MKTLYELLYKLYIEELHRLNIGYSINDNNVEKMFDLVNIIDYIENGHPLSIEISKILSYYE